MSGEQAVVCCHQERCQQQPSTRRARNLQRRRTPTSPKSPSMPTERHPCRSRIASAFPSSGTYMSEPQLGVIRLCHGWIGDDSRCRGRRTQITQCEAAPHSVGQRMRGLTTRRETWERQRVTFSNIPNSLSS
jgi:hypothetical protein